MTEKVNILVVYWHTDIFIDKWVRQLLKTDYDDYKIYIIDNTLKSKKKLKNKFNSEKIKIVNGAKRPTGGSASVNRHQPDSWDLILSKTNSKYIAIFDCDCWPIDSSWLKKCFGYIKMEKVKLVGIQYESSIRSCFHFFKRETLRKLNYHYNKQRKSFGKENIDLKRYVKYPDGVYSFRKKWDFGEDFCIGIYKKGKNTVGFNPTKGFVPFKITEEKKKIKACWREFGVDSYGVVYGDMFFHVGKTYRKHKELSEYKNFYEKDKYLESYYYIDKEYDDIVVNKGIHNNFCDMFHKEFIYKNKEK